MTSVALISLTTTQVSLLNGNIENTGGDIDEYVNTGVSCPDLCVKYDVDIREFVILAYLQDCGDADAETIGLAVGLSPTTAIACLASLRENGLVRWSDARGSRLVPSLEGIALLRKAGQ